MAFAKELVATLKTELRSKRVTYLDVSKHLELSESSVKRIFSEGDMTLQRLESICSLIELDICTLAAKADEQRRHIKRLTLEQEKLLVNNEKLLLLTVHLIYGWSYQQILDTYEIELHEGQRMLTQLDNMKLIELMRDNRVRILLSADFQWIQSGPIQQFFERSVQNEFFESRFSGDGELRLVMNGWLSMHSLKAFHENMTRLTREFEAQKSFDQHVPVEERRGTTLVVAVRPWTLEIFDKYVKAGSRADSLRRR